ncbi:MAG TPA: hypothetical protein VKO63_00075 [Chitinispirillaceae bacterium]|nr:hypothetical protein [Chitinispirillaceae bacterium]
MSDLTFSQLDTSCDAQVEKYERTLFKSLYTGPSPVASLIWDVDKANRRLRSKIPYQNRTIIVGMLNDSIVTGASINTTNNEPWQCDLLGFQIDKCESGICEGSALFSTLMFYNSQLVALEMKRFMDVYMKKSNITKIYGNCRSKLLKGYMNLGWKLIGTKEIDDIVENLIYYTVT